MVVGVSVAASAIKSEAVASGRPILSGDARSMVERGSSDMWRADFKGWLRTRDGRHCGPRHLCAHGGITDK
jgi:hypothetical protein